MEERQDGNIIKRDIDEEMRTAYIDYAISVIVSRALPDVRDGLKPVHRRILYAMHEDGITSDKPYRKCANTVGSVLGRYHPHGDASVYDAMVRMAQDFSMRYMLIDGHGNFGSIDGDGAAAMRYTEARMSKIAEQMLVDIEKNTVDFMPNYDDRLQEPTVLPTKIPTLLINGSSGIAVGMATNIPPHNLTEVINGIIKIIDDDNVTDEQLMQIIKGPDFPTEGLILGREGIKEAYTTGRGKIIMRAEAEIEEMSGNKQRIIVSSLPYQVNKARLIENIAHLCKEKRIEGISELRDESDRNDRVRIVIELKRDANANIVLNQLYKNTQMQDTFGVIMLALVNNEPKILTLRQCLDCYIDHRKDVILRRTQFDLDKALARAHILEGLRIAIDNIDEVIAIIRSSYDDAKERLMKRFGLTDIQAQAILDMRLKTLSGLQREKIEEEYKQLMELIAHLRAILASEKLVFDIIKEELIERGISKENIFLISFESQKYNKIQNFMELDVCVNNLIKNTSGKIYLLFDEIQNIVGWEKSINSYRVDFDCDIYITGSNSELLSGELATLIAGRYFHIDVYPFSFKEFLQYKKEINSIDVKNKELQLFNEYVKYGGMPSLQQVQDIDKFSYLEDIYSTILLKDIISRHNLRNAEILNRILTFIISNIGQPVSANGISKYLKHENLKVSADTVLNYLSFSKNACFIHEAKKENLKGKKVLKTNGKYYLVDHGFNQAIIGKDMENTGQILENIVYIELLRRGYDVKVGDINGRDEDFVCKKVDRKIYIQVSYLF